MRQIHRHCVLLAVCALPTLAEHPVFLEAGTEFTVRTDSVIDSTAHHAGDKLTGTLAEPIQADDTVLLPKGKECQITIVESKESGRLKGRSSLTFTLTGLVMDGRWFTLKSAPEIYRGESRLGDTAKVAGTGAAIGALIGSISSSGAGAGIGAAAGAAVGTGLTAMLPKRKIVIPAETRWTFTLEESVQVGGEKK